MRMRSRSGFTLIELMVAMALTLFVMVILSQAFVSSLDTFSGIKGIGDMQVNLRTAEVMLRADLSADHHEGKRRLSDMTLSGAANIVAQPPQAGFFAVRRSTALGATTNYVYEGSDAFGVPSYRAVDQMIYMTVKRKGNRQENFFNAPLAGAPADLGKFFAQVTAYNVPPSPDLAVATQTPPYQAGSSTGVYASQWAEVFYYLVRSGTTENALDAAGTTGTPIYSLYRAEFVMTPDGTNVTNATIANGALGTFASMSCNQGGAGLVFYSPANAAFGQRVIPDLATPLPNARVIAGSTLVMPNVISFHVQIMPIDSTAAAWGVPARTFMDVPNNTGQSYGIYDTAKFSTAGYPVGGLKGVSVTFRVWDNKTRQTRQATVVQDL